MNCPRPNRRLIAACFLGLLLAYLSSAIVVFDFLAVAYSSDEDNTSAGRPVAIGPKPRTFFCRPTVHDVRFNGDEWPFVYYQPICAGWRVMRGFAAPSEVRGQP